MSALLMNAIDQYNVKTEMKPNSVDGRHQDLKGMHGCVMRMIRRSFVLVVGLLVPIFALASSITITSPTNNQVFAVGAPMTISGTAVMGGNDFSIQFFKGSTLIGVQTGVVSSFSFSYTNTVAGTYVITAKIATLTGISAVSNPVTIIVAAAPTVSLTAPTANQVFPTPGTITLTATASASAGATISKVDFYQGTTFIATDTSSPYSVTWSNPAAGSYSLTAKATDSRGLVTTSTAVPIVVAVPPTVSLTAPTANQIFTAPASVTLTATASASSGATISQVDFYQGATLIATDTTSPYSTIWNGVVAGSYSLTAKATDSRGLATTSAAVPITVNSAQPSLYYIYPDQIGTPRLVTDSSNNIVWRNILGEPFGNTPPEENPSGLGVFHFNLGPSRYYRDVETNTFYAYYRDAYDPATGRFDQFDPIGLAGGLNGYVYVENAPTMYIDPLGLFHCVQGADCNLSPDTTQSMQCFDTCTGRDTAVTSGRGNRSRPNSSHARGEACDIGRGANPDLSRESAEQCTIQCFPQGYGQEEGNRNGGTHFHVQQHTVPGGAPGFAPGIRRYSP